MTPFGHQPYAPSWRTVRTRAQRRRAIWRFSLAAVACTMLGAALGYLAVVALAGS